MGDSYGLRVTPAGTVKPFFYNGSSWPNLTSSSTTNDGNWHHVVGQYTGSQIEVYVDGGSPVTVSASGPIVYPPGRSFLVGQHGNGSTSYNFNGSVDQVRVYGRALSAGEIAALYDEGIGGAGEYPTEIVIHAATASPALSGSWMFDPDASAAGGSKVRHPDAGLGTLDPPPASPTHYFEIDFEVRKDTAYHLWVRGRADGDSAANDSVYFQFDHSVTAGGAPIYRIGTSGSGSATEVNLENCTGCGLSGWGWQDNGWNYTLGPDVYFDHDGPQRMRVQTRQDGFSIDQIVLSHATYRTAAPGPMQDDTTILPLPGNQPPQISAGPSASQTSGPAPLDVTFNVTASDAEGPVTYSWDFDGDAVEDSTLQDPSHTYVTAGTYTARVTVRDAAGATVWAETAQIMVSTPGSPQTVKFMTFNISKGRYHDPSSGNFQCSFDDVADHILAEGVHIVSLNEVMTVPQGACDTICPESDSHQAAMLEQALESKSGLTWSWYYRPSSDDPGSPLNTGGNALIWRDDLPDSGWTPQTAYHVYTTQVAAVAIAVTLQINGHQVAFFSTHLTCNSSCGGGSTLRQAQVSQLKTFAESRAPSLVIAGDFNAQAGTAEINDMVADYYDGWAQAEAMDTEIGTGETRPSGSRIDFVFVNKPPSNVTVDAAKTSQPRKEDDAEVHLSDHFPLTVTVGVN